MDTKNKRMKSSFFRIISYVFITLLAIVFLGYTLSLLSLSTFIGIIFGLLLIYTFFFNPSYPFFLILMVRVFGDRVSQYLYFYYQDYSFNGVALLGGLTISMAFAFCIIHRINILKIPLSKLFLSLLIFGLFSFSYSIDKAESLYEFVRLISIYAMYVYGYGLFQKKILSPNKFLKYSIIISSIPFIIAFYQLITGTGMVDVNDSVSAGRLYGTFTAPPQFAFYNAIISSIFIFLYFKEINLNKNSPKSKVLLGSLLLTLVILLGTLSRGAILSFIIVLTIFSIKKKPSIIAGLAIISMILYAAVEPIRDRVNETFDPPSYNSSIYWRFEQWDKALIMIKKKPILGHGIGTSGAAYEDYFNVEYEAGRHPHNDFYRMGIELGIIGVIFYTLMLLIIFVRLMLLLKDAKNEDQENFAIIVIGLFLGFITYSLTDNGLRQTMSNWYLWILMGVVFVNNVKNKDLPSPTLPK